MKAGRETLIGLSTVEGALGGKADAQFTRQQLELEIDALHAELYELRRELSRRDNDKA